EPMMYRLVPLLADFFKDTFPGFWEQRDFIKKVIEQEENSFLRTLEGGLKRFESIKAKGKVIPGKDAFELYDTYGFPIDLTRLIASEKGWSIDEVGFENSLNEQKNRSRSDSAKSTGDWIEVNSFKQSPTFDGYDHDQIDGAKLIKYRRVEDREGVKYQVVLDRTSFYPEGGGQVGDTGQLSFGDEVIHVKDMVKENDLPIHITDQIPHSVSLPVTT